MYFTRVLGSSSWKIKPLTVADDEWEDLDAKALSTIHLCLMNDVLFNIIGEKSATSLWNKLESLYMTKSVTNIIYLKQQLYGMRMKEGTTIAYIFECF